MVERASIFEAIQLGVEVTAGTAVAANKKLLATGIQPAIKIETLPYRPTGSKFRSLVVPGKEWVAAKIGGVAAYNDLAYLLSSLVSYAAPAQQAATAAYLWTFEPDTDGPDTKKSYTIEQGSSVRAAEFAYGLVNGLTIDFSRSGIEVDGEMIGTALDDGITMTAAPTEIALKPVLPTEIDIYLADTQAGLAGASALTRALSASWSLTDRYGMVFPLNSSNGTGWAVDVETEPKLEAKLKMAADATGMGLLTTLRAGDSKFIRIEASGVTIEGAYDYNLQIDMAGKVEDVGEFADEDGLFAIEWTFSGVHDSTWTKATQIDLMNILTDV